jgi:signal transduction histidine kinase
MSMNELADALEAIEEKNRRIAQLERDNLILARRLETVLGVNEQIVAMCNQVQRILRPR